MTKESFWEQQRTTKLHWMFVLPNPNQLSAESIHVELTISKRKPRIYIYNLTGNLQHLVTLKQSGRFRKFFKSLSRRLDLKLLLNSNFDGQKAVSVSLSLDFR